MLMDSAAPGNECFKSSAQHYKEARMKYPVLLGENYPGWMGQEILSQNKLESLARLSRLEAKWFLGQHISFFLSTNM